MTAPTAHYPAPAARGTSGTGRLRTLLRADAAMCAALGVLAATAAGPVADLLGPDVSGTVVRVVGVVLVLWAVDAALLARASDRIVRVTAWAAALANIGWEAATIALVALGAFSVGGAVAALVLAGAAGGLGLLQLRALRA